MQRLVLFDIDETMLKSDGAGRRAITRALGEFFGTTCDSSSVRMSGRTDPQICEEILRLSGCSTRDIEHGLPGALALYIKYLEEEIRNAKDYRLHEGVLELLRLLAGHKGIYLGLLTGNIEAGARLKLSPFGINDYFQIGAFGSDSPHRNELPAFAHQRAVDAFKVSFQKQEMVVIGDSVHDVACAKSFGARSLAIATGSTSSPDLLAQKPDFLFSTLRDTQSVFDAICS